VSPWLEIAVAVVMLVGLLGVVVPVLPGLLLSWLAVVAWALLDGGGTVRWAAVVVVGLTAVVGYVVATVVPGRRTAEAGAPDWVLLVGFAGMVVGFFVVPVVGFVIGGVLGVWLAELARTRDPRAAWAVTVATLKGFGIGILVQFGIGLMMIAEWLAAVAVS
jgi:uncharacterized protein YqgC (DUF456 family)